MDFNNIKKGDSVYIPIEVPIKHRETKPFLAEYKVTRTTDTQFLVTIDGREARFRKRNGQKIGAYWSVLKKGICQRKEMEAFQKKVKLVNSVNSLMYQKNVEVFNSLLFLEDLNGLLLKIDTNKGRKRDRR